MSSCFASLTFAQAAIPPLPATPKHPVTDEYHGVKVTDDYRWLENGKDPAVIAWSEAQSAHTRAVLDALHCPGFISAQRGACAAAAVPGTARVCRPSVWLSSTAKPPSHSVFSWLL